MVQSKKMGLISFKTLIAVIVLVTSLIFYEKLNLLFNNVMLSYSNYSDDTLSHVFTAETLRKFNGISEQKLYLSLLGNIFDVSKGEKHYGKDGPYNYFVGRDGSRSFITGDFQDDTETSDHVLDRSCEELFNLDHWVTIMKEKYQYTGVLKGRYFDGNGEETEYSKQLASKIKQCETEKQLSEVDKLKYPACNMEWSADKGTRVWCSKSSGGISRSWVGVPRQLYTPGEENPRCVCFNPTNMQDPELREYANCLPTAISCNINP